MKAEPCPRHPGATAHRGQCPACLLERALGENTEGAAPLGRFTIEVPLGRSARGSVFLVRGEWPWRRLLRLKQWTQAAPPGFLAEVARLRSRLEHLDLPTIVMPVTAWLEPGGTPSALTDFRQGMPLLEAVRGGSLAVPAALSLVHQLRQVVLSAHAAGLAHGSLGPGNLLAGPQASTIVLLDFGFAPALSGRPADEIWRAADLSGLATLESRVVSLATRDQSGGPA